MLTSRALAAGLLLAFTGCRPPSVTLSAPRPPAIEGPSIIARLHRLKIRVHPLDDDRARFRSIGERSSYGVSLGEVTLDQPPADVMQAVLVHEFAEAGHEVVDAGEAVVLGGTIEEFGVRTENTPFYWDVFGTVRLVLRIDAPGNGTRTELRYAAERSERSWVWPGKAMMERVLARALEDVVRQIRADDHLADAMARAAGKR